MFFNLINKNLKSHMNLISQNIQHIQNSISFIHILDRLFELASDIKIILEF